MAGVVPKNWKELDTITCPSSGSWGELKPNQKTIAKFRKNNQKGVAKILKQTDFLCIKLDLIEGACLFIDSTKIRGAASISQPRTI